MSRLSTYHLFSILLVIVCLLIVIFVGPQIIAYAQNQISTKISPLNPEKEETVEGSHYMSLGITSSDSPEIVAYKLFRNFDPLFINESVNNKIIYNPFILDLKGNVYPYNPLAPSNVLINNISQGVKDFSKIDSSYQVGNNPVNLNSIVKSDSNINYNNDCWTNNMDNNLANMPLNTFKIFVNSNTNKFDGKVKIRVGWYDKNSKSGGREIIDVLITVCDG